MRKVFLTAAIALTTLCLPLSCVPVLYALNSVNPMQLAFITSISVENQSGQNVRFTPVGTYGPESNKWRLPTYVTKVPAIPSPRNSNYFLANGQSRTILYDWDDINLSEIAVDTGEGKFLQLTVDPDPPKNDYYRPEQNHLVIPAISHLSPVDPGVEAAVRDSHSRWRLYVVLMGGTAVPLVLVRLVRTYRKERLAANG